MNKELDSVIKDEICKFYGVTEQEILEGAEFKSYRGAKFKNDFYSPSRIPSVICDYLYYEISVLSDSYEEWFESYGFQGRVDYCRQLIESDEKIMSEILEIESKCILRLNSLEIIKNLLLSIQNLHDNIFVLHHRLDEYKLLEQERNDVKDFADLLKRASNGELQAQIEVSERYATGRGTEKNETEAFEWRKKAAEQGDVESQVLIADFYKRGYGIAKNKEEAFNWYIKSAENNNDKSMYFVGECYYQGQGIRQDFDKAFYWFVRSAEKGYRSAKYWVGKCYYEGIGVKSDHDLAFKWIEEAAKAENQPAKKFLNVHPDEYKEYRSRMKK